MQCNPVVATSTPQIILRYFLISQMHIKNLIFVVRHPPALRQNTYFVQSWMQSVLFPSFKQQAALFEYRMHRSSGLSKPAPRHISAIWSGGKNLKEHFFVVVVLAAARKKNSQTGIELRLDQELGWSSTTPSYCKLSLSPFVSPLSQQWTVTPLGHVDVVVWVSTKAHSQYRSRLHSFAWQHLCNVGYDNSCQFHPLNSRTETALLRKNLPRQPLNSQGWHRVLKVQLNIWSWPHTVAAWTVQSSVDMVKWVN